ncbi:MAG: alpha/beta fold hydrolase [Bacteroidota bacterium]|jgi:pimeloyl-ACP methyl ester carboxylesterase
MTAIQKIHLPMAGGQLFFRTSGKGPLLVLLHPSPQHSGRMEGLLSLLSPHFQVVAPDTPGYGLSDQLQPAPEQMSDYLPFIEAIREHFCASAIYLYGTATGAQLAIAYALAYPEKVNHLFLDNAAHFDEDMRNQLLEKYFISLEPTPNGAHLERLWQMAEKSCLFFPWYSEDEKHRIANVLPPPEIIQGIVQDHLIAGKDYGRAYRAAFLHEKAAHLQQLKIPATFFRWLGSPLLSYMNHLLEFELPANIQVVDTPAGLSERWKVMQQTIFSVLFKS